MTYEPRQRIMTEIGKNGCYLLSIIHAAEVITHRRIDAVEVYLDAVEKKWSEIDCYLVHPDLILGSLTGRVYTIRHDKADYEGQTNEVVIRRYELSKTGVTFSHFILYSPTIYDPYGNSTTVKFGKCVSTRVFSL